MFSFGLLARADRLVEQFFRSSEFPLTDIWLGCIFGVKKYVLVDGASRGWWTRVSYFWLERLAARAKSALTHLESSSNTTSSSAVPHLNVGWLIGLSRLGVAEWVESAGLVVKWA